MGLDCKKKKKEYKDNLFFSLSNNRVARDIDKCKKQRLQIKFENQMKREKGRDFYKFT